MKKIAASAIAVMLAATFATSSFADETTPKPSPARGDGYETSDGAGASYSVKFVDEALQAPGTDGSAPLIHVRPQVGRATLIRPRLQFVTELLKTVENL